VYGRVWRFGSVVCLRSRLTCLVLSLFSSLLHPIFPLNPFSPAHSGGHQYSLFFTSPLLSPPLCFFPCPLLCVRQPTSTQLSDLQDSTSYIFITHPVQHPISPNQDHPDPAVPGEDAVELCTRAFTPGRVTRAARLCWRKSYWRCGWVGTGT